MDVAGVSLWGMTLPLDRDLNLAVGKRFGDSQRQRIPRGSPCTSVSSFLVLPEFHQSLVSAFCLLAIRPQVELMLDVFACSLVELPAKIASVLTVGLSRPILPLPRRHGGISRGPR